MEPSANVAESNPPLPHPNTAQTSAAWSSTQRPFRRHARMAFKSSTTPHSLPAQNQSSISATSTRLLSSHTRKKAPTRARLQNPLTIQGRPALIQDSQRVRFGGALLIQALELTPQILRQEEGTGADVRGPGRELESAGTPGLRVDT